MYHPDAAPLPHNFISRVRWLVFYDAHNEEGLDDLIGRLVVRWPQAVRNMRRYDEPSLVVVEGA